jgi:hypothetical protein
LLKVYYGPTPKTSLKNYIEKKFEENNLHTPDPNLKEADCDWFLRWCKANHPSQYFYSEDQCWRFYKYINHAPSVVEEIKKQKDTFRMMLSQFLCTVNSLKTQRINPEEKIFNDMK